MKRILRKILLVTTLLALVLILASCNKDCIDTVYTYDYAIIQMPDGTTEKIEIAQWKDYEDGEQIQIKAKDGTTYLVSSFNCVLIKEK